MTEETITPRTGDTLQSGDVLQPGEQFTRLLMQNQKRFWGLIRSLVPNGPDADDVLQETCSVMWRKYSEFEQGTDFAAWGLAIARFQVMRYYSRCKSDRARLSNEVIEAVAIEFSSPEQANRSTAREAALKGCMAKLKTVQFDTLHRRYGEGQAVEEIAVEMNVSIHAIYKRLDRTCQQLFRCITTTLKQQEGLA
ncbi:RNA polymerase sigma-70 factor, Rhodopirellula/Verrucomicrobium family [Neorhodopirellula lusitana]|uniref:RNA polymerase sigma-70 factor, Rhodopirellula/Verrucomicrobium family n=1 Tax=Neorhodopirellula lusitana TaxID=445327 RepID=A0ABY1QEA3_9BACT|nr:sigma-70 family RNA polymerase sigma factor [Neorhodopirellula lusitana]SMP69033.1 RNA polymerase sigma-70 factor, Rhodopirellula/Verrucomicrobium family [Neorhodopirellula lusitana]